MQPGGMYRPPPPGGMNNQIPPQNAPMQPPAHSTGMAPGPGMPPTPGILKQGQPYQNGQQGDHVNQMASQMKNMNIQQPQQYSQPGPPRPGMPPPHQPNAQFRPPGGQQLPSNPPMGGPHPSAPSPSFGAQPAVSPPTPPLSQYNSAGMSTAPVMAPGPQNRMAPPISQAPMSQAPPAAGVPSVGQQMNRPPPPGGALYNQHPGMNVAPPTPQINGAPPGQFSQPGTHFGAAPPQFSNAGGPPQPGSMMPPSGSGMPPSGPGMPPSGPGMPPSGPGMPPSGPGMPPSGPGMLPPGPGMPPAGPGMPPPGPGMPQMPGQQFMGTPAPAQPRRLDPDQMPSPIQVIVDDQRSKSGMFPTGQRGLVPPLVTTNFVSQDQGNCNPRFMRSTMYNVPVNNEMMKQCKIPFGLVCSPYAKVIEGEHSPPLVNLGDLGPVRCKRCRAYMSPHMQFTDGGRRFNCPFCTCITDVPQEYFAHLDHTGKRIDTYERPELCLGSYEFVATKDYCKNGVLPNAPAFIFMIDVSYNSIKSGLVHILCQHLRDDILPHLPKEQGMEESEIRVGFVTYSSVLHFYNVKANLVQPHMMVVGDVQDVFVPLIDGFLVKLSEADSVIQCLLEQLPDLFADSRDTEIVLGPVIQAGLDALKSAGCPGKLFIFHTSLPTFEAPGKLKGREDRKLLGTEKEKTVLTPQSPFYTTLAQDCVVHGCGVDLFLFPNSYTDVATIGEACKLTGGDIYKYDYFTADTHGSKFINDLKMAVSKQIAFDCIVRVRTSTGIRPVDFFGNFYMSNTTDVEIAVVDCDKAFCVEIKHDDKLNEGETAYVQVAMLFTSMTGQRRLRIHNLALGVCAQMADLFRCVELDALINFISKSALRTQLQKTPKDMREAIMSQCAEILACYRRNCATPSSAGQLILPESMKLLPLYSNCVIKNDALQAGSEISTDTRSQLMHIVNSLDVSSSMPFFYPRLIPLHDVDVNSESIPTQIRCSVEKISDTGAYLLENGFSMFLWLGFNISSEFVQSVFGVSSLGQINIETGMLLELDNPMSQRINGIIRKVRAQRSRFMKLTIVRQRDKLEAWFNHFLVEDKSVCDNVPTDKHLAPALTTPALTTTPFEKLVDNTLVSYMYHFSQDT